MLREQVCWLQLQKAKDKKAKKEHRFPFPRVFSIFFGSLLCETLICRRVPPVATLLAKREGEKRTLLGKKRKCANFWEMVVSF